jgi:hypothetical protein
MLPTVTDQPSDIDPSRALELLREQVALFAKLEGLSVRQQALVAGEAIEPLMSVLADRQRVSVRLAKIAEALGPVRRSWKQFRDALDATQRDEAEKFIASAEASLKRLIESDERDARILSARKRRVADTLSGLNSSGGAVAAYRRETQTVRRMDLVSEDA